MSGQTLGTFGYAKLNSTVVLLRPGGSFSEPLNANIPDPLNGYGGYGQMNVENGFQVPQVNLPCVALDTGAENWLSAANLNSWFVTRSARPVWDLGALSALVFSENGSVGDSQGIWNVAGSKGAGFSISTQKGQPLSVVMRFGGTIATPETTGSNRPTTGLAGTPLMFNRVTLGGGLANVGITGFTLNFDTALTPNMELNGLFTPSEQNAGVPTATLSIQMNAVDTVPPPGWDPSTNLVSEVTNGTIAFKTVDLGGVGDVTVTITIQRLRIKNPRDRNGQVGRVGRQFTYDCLATTTAQPISIA